jgi:hypothetical protein
MIIVSSRRILDAPRPLASSVFHRGFEHQRPELALHSRKQAYKSIRGHAPKRTFLGFYADVSTLAPDTEHRIELTLPSLIPGQFPGLFFENIEPEYASTIR